jgi:hypothetical protein
MISKCKEVKMEETNQQANISQVPIEKPVEKRKRGRPKKVKEEIKN